MESQRPPYRNPPPLNHAGRDQPTFPLEESYLTSGGTHCPECGSHSFQGHAVEIDQGTATQLVTCNECAAAWTDVYLLVRVEPA